MELISSDTIFLVISNILEVLPCPIEQFIIVVSLLVKSMFLTKKSLIYPFHQF